MQIYKYDNLIISEIIFVPVDMHRQWQKLYFEGVGIYWRFVYLHLRI